MPGARHSLEEREKIALGIASGRSSGVDGVTRGRPERWSPPLPVGRCGAGDTPACVPPGRWRWRSSGVCGCCTRRTRLANRLRLEHLDEPHWWVSHETIYQALYLQGRGGLKAELTDALRTGRARRRRKGPNPGRGARGKLKDIVSISERPAEVADRAVPGHWEGDLILDRGGKSQIATIVERTRA
jgi:hypothetical protein